MAHRLDGVRAKIERATEHVEKLITDARDMERRAYAILQERNAEGGTITVFVKQVGPVDPPIQLALVAGEIAYQLRSALDHLVYQLIVANRQSPNRLSQFPIFAARDKYVARAPSMIEGVSSSAEVIIESEQPYHRSPGAEEHPLWKLHYLNNTDKHRLVPVCRVLPTGVSVRFLGNEPFSATGHPPRVLEEGTEFVFETSDPKAEMQFEVFRDLAFEQIGGTKPERALPFLTQAIAEVDRIVGRFDGEFR
jgi:hypothetical protein